jgi:hypothetical protein
LYERCVIACANYPEYWIRYVLCMEASESLDLANNVLARASQVFVKVIYFKCQSCRFGNHLLFLVLYSSPVFKLNKWMIYIMGSNTSHKIIVNKT